MGGYQHVGARSPTRHLPPPVQRGTPAHPAQHNKLGQLQAVAQRLRPNARLSEMGGVDNKWLSTGGGRVQGDRILNLQQ